ncbi:MAG: 2-isopropylmalate synthase, partial [Lachnospiraceae bacterium]|nr:2-isopropylmalate synthase [Candidatus Merdinaster equi]
AEEEILTIHDDKEAVIKAVNKLGYDLSEDDGDAVFEAFKRIAAKKEKVTSRDLDAIVATNAMQVPSRYKLESYIANTGNKIASMVHVILEDGASIKDGISVGAGPIDAAFLAIEQIIGRHFELDDFQIRAVTEGKEAAGEAIVKLRSEGKVYSGKGLSTDIIGASIRAYLNALNKIVYEEEEA